MDTELIAQRYNLLKPFFNERQRRLLAAAEADVIGYGGISVVSRSTRVSRRAITQGQKELRTPPPCEEARADRVRKKGGGRKQAVESIRRWWHSMGQPPYSQASRLLITADCGGGNGYRLRLWKRELQKLANETGLTVSVCHFPPGTSKWNHIEHRLFSFITQNWRGKPLISHEVIVNMIAATKNRKGLRVEYRLDTNTYPGGIKVSNEEMESIHIHQNDFHGEWNYTIQKNIS